MKVEQTAEMIRQMMVQAGHLEENVKIKSVTLESIEAKCTNYIALLSDGSAMYLQHFGDKPEGKPS